MRDGRVERDEPNREPLDAAAWAAMPHGAVDAAMLPGPAP